MDKFKYYLVLDSGDVLGTDDDTVAAAASKDGSTVVIDYSKGTATFDSETIGIEEAMPADWLRDDLGPEDEDPDTSDDGVSRRKDPSEEDNT